MTDKIMKCIIDKENFNSLTNASKIVRAAVVVRFTRDVTEARLVVLESAAAAILTHATIDVKTRDVSLVNLTETSVKPAYNVCNAMQA